MTFFSYNEVRDVIIFRIFIMKDDDFKHFDEDATQFTCFEETELSKIIEDTDQTKEDENYRPLKVGSIFLGKYTIIKVLGSGNFGIIYLLEANDASKKLLVAKEFFPKGFVTRGDNDEVILKPSLTQKELKSYQFMNEIFIGEAKNLVKVTEKSHPNIVTFFALEENKNNTIYFIMNYEEGISLKEYLYKRKKEDQGKLTNREIYNLALPLLDGLKQIHEVGVYHQDIKLENILIREGGAPILLDFGASVILYDEESKKYFNAATPRYAAIEQINVDQPPKINETTDIYAMGVLLHKLITDAFPPKSKIRLDAIKKGQKDPYIPLGNNKKLKNYDRQLLNAVDKALQIPQDDRFQNAQEFIDALHNKKKMLRYFLLGLLGLLALIFLILPSKTGKVKINIPQKNYSIYIDGTKYSLDKDNMLVTETGKHKINITKNGYIPYEKTIYVKENNILNISTDLTPTQQAVTIETDTKDATIILNGRTLKHNIFTARYGETYKLKIIAKGRETIEKEITYNRLFQNNFKLYYKLPINKINATINVNLPMEIGITKIKINNEPLRDKTFIAEKGKTYKISIINPYYEPLQVSRTFKDFYNDPQQTFTLSKGEGKVTITTKPDNAKVMVYQIIDDQEIKITTKPYTINGPTSIVLPATDKIFMIISKEGYKTVRSRIFPIRHAMTITKHFELASNKEKSSLSSIVPNATPYTHEMIPIPNTNFSMSKHEVTYDAFIRFLNSSKLAQRNKDKDGNKLYGGKIFKYVLQTPDGFIVSRAYKNYPINYISWYGAKAYIDWLSKKTKKHYLLPTEKQWEQVAKAGYNSKNLSLSANYNSGVLFQTGIIKPNPYGIYDLFGNVFEWTATPYGKDKHIIKGGSYRSKKSFLTPYKHSEEYNQNINRRDLGFRLIELTKQ